MADQPNSVSQDTGTVVPAEEFDKLPDDSEKYQDIPGNIATAAQGFTATALPGIAPAIETELSSAATGVPKEQIEQEYREMKEQNPVAYGVGQAAGLMFSPVGKAIGAVGKGASALVGGGITGAAAQVAAESALLQATDETAKFVLQDPNQSVQTAATDLAMSTILGSAVGGAGGLVAKGLEKVAASKAGEFMQDFRSRILEHVSEHDLKISHSWEAGPIETMPGGVKQGPIPNFPGRPGEPLFNPDIESTPIKRITTYSEGMEDATTAGAKAADAFMKSKYAGRGLGYAAGQAIGRMTGIPGMGYIGGVAGAKYAGPTIDAIIKPIIRGAVGFSSEGLGSAGKFIASVAKGQDLMTNAAKSVFEAGISTARDLKPDREDLETLDNHVSTLSQHPEAMMNIGGNLGHYLPEQQTALATTAQNVVNYLNSRTPRDIQSGVLNKPIQPSATAQAAYNRTLSLAQQPLTLVHYLKEGSLTPKDVNDVQAMYPNLLPAITQKINDSMINHIAKGNQVPYKLRVGLSHLMGQPLDSSLTPFAMQAAQATYIPRQPPQMPQNQSKAKKGTSKLGKQAEMAQTPQESRNKALSKA